MTSIALLTDFSDWLSPMVVKELRQGLRTRLFGGVVLVLHALLVIITLIGGTAEDGSEVRGLMDGLITFVLFVIFPLCGFSALAGEIKANTMDMLVLTRLSAGRIVLGKWAAIVFQSLLVTVSVVPYIVARYVYGGSELFADLSALAFQWLVSAVLTAGVVALSTQKQFWLRALVLVVPLFISGITSMVRVTTGIMGRSTSSPGVSEQNIWMVAGWTLGGAWLIFALLSYGASKIAPAASLLSVTKRWVNLGALFVLPTIQWFATQGHDIKVVLIVVMVVASIDALSEQVHGLPSLYLPFYRRSWWGRLASWFLVPGWMHGFLYSLLIISLSCLMVRFVGDPVEAARMWLIGCCLWFAALMAQILSFRRQGDYMAAMFAGFFILYVLTMLGSLVMLASRYKDEVQWMQWLLPSSAMTATIDHSHVSYFLAGLAINTIWPVILLLFALNTFRHTRSARKEALNSLIA